MSDLGVLLIPFLIGGFGLTLAIVRGWDFFRSLVGQVIGRD